MKVGLFGGVFNPVHFGHLMIARQVLDFTDVDEVWFLPNYGQSPPKPGVVDFSHRLEMLQLVSFLNTRISTLEADHMLDGKTISLLPFLSPENQYVFIMGSDWLSGFTKWDRWEDLLQKLPFYVMPRNGFPVTPLYNNMTEIKDANLIVTDISSTKIRDRLSRGLSIDQFVPGAVVQYIKDHGLYT